MIDLIQDLTDQIANAGNVLDLPFEEAGYIKGLRYAIDRITNFVCDNLIVGATYYILQFEDGKVEKPFITKMRLYKTREGKKNSRTKYFFTYNLDRKKFWEDKEDFVINKSRNLPLTVFARFEDAEEVALKKVPRYLRNKIVF